MVKYLMYYAPIGLGAYFATLVGDYGPNLLGAYLRSMIVYTLPPSDISLWHSRSTPGSQQRARSGHLLEKHHNSSITALGTQSSNATLPVNLVAAHNIGIPKDIAEIVLPIGATATWKAPASAASSDRVPLRHLQHSSHGSGNETTAVAVAVLSGVVLSGIPEEDLWERC